MLSWPVASEAAIAAPASSSLVAIAAEAAEEACALPVRVARTEISALADEVASAVPSSATALPVPEVLKASLTSTFDGVVPSDHTIAAR